MQRITTIVLFLLFSIALILIFIGLSGCGGGAMHATETVTYPDRVVRVDYWIAAGHFLSDPEIGEVTRNADGSWSIKGFKSTTDNAGLSSIVEGVVAGVVKGAKP